MPEPFVKAVSRSAKIEYRKVIKQAFTSTFLQEFEGSPQNPHKFGKETKWSKTTDMNLSTGIKELN